MENKIADLDVVRQTKAIKIYTVVGISKEFLFLDKDLCNNQIFDA
jgi:hypothetical protein